MTQNMTRHVSIFILSILVCTGIGSPEVEDRHDLDTVDNFCAGRQRMKENCRS